MSFFRGAVTSYPLRTLALPERNNYDVLCFQEFATAMVARLLMFGAMCAYRLPGTNKKNGTSNTNNNHYRHHLPSPPLNIMVVEVVVMRVGVGVGVCGRGTLVTIMGRGRGVTSQLGMRWKPGI